MTQRTSVQVRPATDDDVPRLTEIYNHYILTTPATFDIEPFTVEQRREWFSHYSDTGPHRVLVAEVDGLVTGMAWSSAFRPKRAYETTVETSIYCAPEATGMGIGVVLYEALFEALAGKGGCTGPSRVSRFRTTPRCISTNASGSGKRRC